MSRYIEADKVLKELRLNHNDVIYIDKRDTAKRIEKIPSIDLADYVPKDFHDKTCEAMAKRHQEEIADMVSVVRCKECKEWDKNDHECYADRGIYFPNADDFCSYGDRKESE